MNMRDQMPETAAFVDAMREVFGTDEINQAIRSGRFAARENGHEFGPVAMLDERGLTLDQIYIEKKTPPGNTHRRG